MASRWMIVAAIVLGAALCVGLTTTSLAGKCHKDQKLTIEQLPAAVRATLEDLAQGNPIEDLEKETEDGVTFYSADIIKGDQKVGVEIGEDGKLLNTEIEARDEGKDEANENDEDVAVTFDQLPAAVQKTLKEQAGGAKIEDLEKETEDGVTFYSADIVKGDQKVGVEVAPDGKLLKTEVEGNDEQGENEADED